MTPHAELEKMKLMSGEELALFEAELGGNETEKHKKRFLAQTESAIKHFEKVVKELQKY